MNMLTAAIVALVLASVMSNAVKIFFPKFYRFLGYLNWNTWAWYLEGAGHGTAAVLLKGVCNITAVMFFGITEIIICKTTGIL